MTVLRWHMAFVALAATFIGFAGLERAEAWGSRSNCCTARTNVDVRSPNIHVGGPSVQVYGPNVHHGGVDVRWQTSVSHQSTTFVSGGSNTTIVYGGGSSCCCCAGSTDNGAVSGLNVVSELVDYIETQEEVIVEEMEMRERFVSEISAVQAVCVDDRGTPHPASRPSPDRDVAPEFDGELFRCMSGTAMQVTVGSFDDEGQPDFSTGRSMACAKGEALRHDDGELMCAVQEPRRDCNERSLLRMHGPGVKTVHTTRVETYEVAVPVTRMQTVRRAVVSQEAFTGALTLNGGVGGGVCGGC